MSLPSISASDFDRLLFEVPLLVVKFTAPWCQPCRIYAAIVAAAAQSHPEITFVEVDLEREPALARRWQVRGIPSTLGFRNGALAFQVTGLLNSEALEKHLQTLNG